MRGQTERPGEDLPSQPTSSESQRAIARHPACEVASVNYSNLENKMDTHFGEVFRMFERILGTKKASSRTLRSQRTDSETVASKYRETMRIQKKKLQDVDAAYSDALDKIEKLKEEKAQLRSVILDQAGSEKVSDDEIKQMFTSIRQQIQAISHSESFNLGQMVETHTPCAEEARRFFSDWNSYSLADRRLLMRGKIFDLILHHILGQNLFGLVPVRDNPLNQMEFVLTKLERFLIDSKVPTEVIADWRLATMKAIDEAKVQHYYDGQAAQSIMSFLSCLIRDQKQTVENAKLSRDIFKLCKDAYQLRYLMRKSKAKYTCDVFRRGTSVHDYDAALEVHGVEDEGEESSTIAFTIYGTLVKFTDGDQFVVLEPAHVVVKSL